jgi:hypothetical protein
MTPVELAKKHPRLFHVTEASAWPSIAKHGLLSTKSLLELFEVPVVRALELQTQKRLDPTPIAHHIYGNALLSDNRPLNEKCLADCLDDGLTAKEWLLMLNVRVFFFTSKKHAERLLNAKSNRKKDKLLLIMDTLKLAESFKNQIEICPFNSGTANPQSVPRRGLSTFSPLLKYSHQEWSRLRSRHKKSNDSIREVTVLGAVADIEKYLIEKIFL